MKSMSGKEKFVIAGKLLVDPSGKKMGKTEGNMITLADTPADKFGKIMAQPDSLLELGFEILTDKDMNEIKQRISSGENPRDLKMELAFEVVKRFDSEEEAVKSQENFVNVFSKNNKPQEIEKKKTTGNRRQVVMVLLEMGMVASKSEARRLIEQNGVRIDDKIVEGISDEVEPKDGMVIQVGKRKFVEVYV